MTERKYQIEIHIFKQFYKSVISKGGANIREIRDETDTNIGPSDRDMITINGEEDIVTKAVTQVRQIKNEMVEIITQEQCKDISTRRCSYGEKCHPVTRTWCRSFATPCTV